MPTRDERYVHGLATGLACPSMGRRLDPGLGQFRGPDRAATAGVLPVALRAVSGDSLL